MCKKVLSIILTLALCCGIGLSAEAVAVSNLSATDSFESGNTAQPYYNYTSDVNVDLTNSSGNAKCTTTVNGYAGTATKIKITMTLQKKTLFWWSKDTSWTTTVSDYYASLSKTASVGSGTYRVKAECVVYSGSASETITQYSSERTF